MTILFCSLKFSEILYTNRGDWEAVSECLISDKSRNNEVLALIQQLPTIQIEHLIKKRCNDLIEIDASGFADIIAKRLPDQIPSILNDLSDYPKKKYALLSAFYRLSKKPYEFSDGENRIEIDGNSNLRREQLELTDETLKSLLKLMCIYEPEKARVSF